MSYGYPPPQPEQQPQQPDHSSPEQPAQSSPEWQQPGRPPQGEQQPWQYPPQPGPGWGAPMPPPKKTNVGLIVGAGCGALLLAIVIVGVVVALLRGSDDGGNSGSSPDRSPSVAAPSTAGETPAEEEEILPRHVDAKEDVTIKACSVNSLTKWPDADLEILNSGSDAADYIVYVEFVDSSGTRLAEGLAAATGLGPGQKAKEKAQGLGETSGKVSCKVTNVYRSPAS